MAAPSPRASLGRRTVCGRTEQRRPPVSKRYETKVRMVWGNFLIAIAAATLKTPTKNGYNAQGVNLTFYEYSSLQYIRIYVIYRATQAEYVIRILMAASLEYVKTYSTRRLTSCAWQFARELRARFQRYRGGGNSSSTSHSSLAKELRARFQRYRGGKAPLAYRTVHSGEPANTPFAWAALYRPHDCAI